ncbi:hypothetical protein PR202_ga03482 [Eleusine coracana subsp. coracana]|uniref:Protein kinase domain-containing protein n=1 Tax=Eleusine coracana subsp. coracana TaxID=191504 RepID=A0AAV5BQH2_ELECO|nr:hypothetical protein PR202_ga03482 [Eleusine coracana subsp. coracana]
MMVWWRRIVLLLLLLVADVAAGSGGGDAEALLSLKSSLDGSDVLPWRAETVAGLCSWWAGVRQCDGQGRVRKLVLEGLNLTGSLTAAVLALAPLSELRVLSLRSNALSGPIPDARAFPPNLKLLYLADNRLEGRIPGSLAALHRATVIVLSGNRLSGQIPASLAAIPRLTSLLLDRNMLTGPIPPLRQRTLRLLNVSGNRLSGEIPASLATRFNASSFSLNAGLCGPPLFSEGNPPACNHFVAQAPSGSNSNAAAAAAAPLPSLGSRHGNKAAIVAGATVAGAVVLAILVAAAVVVIRRNKTRVVVDDASSPTSPPPPTTTGGRNGKQDLLHEDEEAQPPTSTTTSATGGGGGGGGVVWEREGIGKLVFTENEMLYTLEDLLRASAETLGRGEVGSTYKAIMETGFIVTVKRMRDPSNSSPSSSSMDFARRAEELGWLRHPNIVPLRAYFQAKEERLLVYDYYPNGSIFTLVHGCQGPDLAETVKLDIHRADTGTGTGSRAASKGKPLHWTSCMKITEDVAAGLLHLHQSSIVHGNLKPSNVLLGPDFESCLTDYGLLMMMMLPDHGHAASSTSLLYRAPEAHRTTAFTAASDVYSFGVLLLELLTGRTPFQDLLVFMNEDDHITSWVRAVREEERDTDSSSGGNTGAAADEKLAALIGIAAACVAADPERRPTMAEVLRMVREARAEAMSSSNSSDRSPARWSDAILAAPSQPFSIDY